MTLKTLPRKNLSSLPAESLVSGRQRSLPKLDFNVTNRCNFRCVHCCFSSGEVLLEEFSIKKIREVLESFKRLGGQRIDVTGGEPLLREDVGEIIAIGKNLGLKIELVTNGSLLDDEKLGLFKKLGLDAVAISLDGSNYDTYKKIRRVDENVYSRVVANIKKCAEYGFYTKVNTVVFNSNLRDLGRITDFCVDSGVSEQGFYYFTPVGRGALAPREVVPPLRWLDVVRREVYPRKDKIKLSIEAPLLEKHLAENLKTACYLENPWHLQLLPDGNVYPCAIMAFYGLPCGNLYRQTLADIWNDKRLWDGSYYRRNVLPQFAKFGGCVRFNKRFQKIVKGGEFSFLCLMCKLKAENFCDS